MHVLERFLMIPLHKLLADTHITKTSTITSKTLLALVRTVNVYLLSIVNHIKITTCGLEKTLMAFIEHKFTVLPLIDISNFCDTEIVNILSGTVSFWRFFLSDISFNKSRPPENCKTHSK